MELLRSRRSERQKAARDKEEEETHEERKESAVSDNDAEDADEDSEGPGSYRGRAHFLRALRTLLGAWVSVGDMHAGICLSRCTRFVASDPLVLAS